MADALTTTWDAYRRAESVEAFAECLLPWLEGTEPHHPGHCGPPAPETQPLLGNLRSIIRAGVLPTSSQPSFSGSRLRQVEYLELILPPHHDVARLASGWSRIRGCQVEVWPLSAQHSRPCTRTPVTWSLGRPCTWLGRWGWDDVFADLPVKELHPLLRDELASAWAVSVIGPQSMRSNDCEQPTIRTITHSLTREDRR